MGKGQRRERQAREIYEAAGYIVQPFYGRPYGETDGFSHFDLVAIRSDSMLEFVQVKSNRAKGIKNMQHEIGHWFPFAHAIARYLVCHDREGWRLLSVLPDKHMVVVDEREQDCKMGAGVTAHLAGETAD